MSDDNIDEILREADKVEVYEFKQLYDFNSIQKDYNSYRRLVTSKMITDLGLFIPVASNKVVLSEKGKRILENGGWINYVESKKERKQKESEKLTYDLKVSKIRAKTFTPILVLGAIGGLYSVVKLLILGWSLVSPIETPKTTMKQQKKLEVKHTSPLDHQNSDSLHNSNLEILFLENGALLDSLTKE